MIDKNVFFGADRAQMLANTDTLQGAVYHSTDPANLVIGRARVWNFSVVGGFDVNLPAANDPSRAGRLGGPTFALINLSTSSTLTLKDADGNTLETVSTDKAIVIGLADDSSIAGIWTRHIQDVA